MSFAKIQLSLQGPYGKPFLTIGPTYGNLQGPLYISIQKNTGMNICFAKIQASLQGPYVKTWLTMWPTWQPIGAHINQHPNNRRPENLHFKNIAPCIWALWKAFPCHWAHMTTYRFPWGRLYSDIQKNTGLKVSFAEMQTILSGPYGKPFLTIMPIWQPIGHPIKQPPKKIQA